MLSINRLVEFLQAIYPDYIQNGIFAKAHNGSGWIEFRNIEKLDAAWDCYLSSGVCPGPGPRKTTVKEGWALVIDDIGTTGPAAETAERALGLPTFEILTSKGNAQWWYVLEQRIPAADWPTFFAEIERLVGQKLHGSEVGHVFRIPFGLNTKTERDEVPVPVEEQNWEVRLGRHDLSRRLDTIGIMLFAEPVAAPSPRPPDEPGRVWDVCGLMKLIPNNTSYKAWMDHGFQLFAIAIDKDEARKAWLWWSEQWTGSGDKYSAESKWDEEIAVKGERTRGDQLHDAAYEANPEKYREWQLRESERPETARVRTTLVRAAFDDGEDFSWLPLEPPKPKLAPQVLASGEFIEGFIPPDYLVKKLITRAFLYSLTGQTGAGKTSITLRLAATVAQGASFGGLGSKPCQVLYLAAENPVDIQMRWIALGNEMGFDVNSIAVFFVKGWFKIGATMKELRAEALRVGGEFGLVVVDTGPVFFEGEDANDRVAQLRHARMMRELIEVIPGHPAVIVNVHPTKNAGADNLLPSGGGSFLNEVDGNLTAARNENQTIELHWQGKWRGVEFAPLHFLLRTVTHPRLIDSDGEAMPTVVCDHLSTEAKEVLELEGLADKDKLLTEMARNPRASMADLAVHMSWYYASGRPDRSMVQRHVNALIKQKLVKKHLKDWIVTGAARSKLNGKGGHPVSTVSAVSIHPDTIDTKEY